MTRTKEWVCRCWTWHAPDSEECPYCHDRKYWWLNHKERSRREFILAKGIAWTYAVPSR